ncbi:hypothetical protein DH09_01390 [Bacillaceae bacterium JMAK1]|nr:hypothetical protein DH09_01390 [Bacillaceae bacterium JMAK1]
MLKVRGLTRRMGDSQLGSINLDVERGTVHAIIGNNGAGKTTLFEAMSGDYPGKGSITINGHPVSSLKGKEQFSYIPQTITELEAFSLRILHKLHKTHDSLWREDRFQTLVKQFNLPMNKHLQRMSIGMKQKSILALQLSRDTPLLMLDEPYTGLDMEGQQILDRLLLQHMEASDDHAIVLATHIADEVQRLADYISILHDGTLSERVEKDELQRRWQRIWIEERVEGINQAPGVVSVSSTRTQEIITQDAAATKAWLTERDVMVIKSQSLKLHESIPHILKTGVSA